MKRTIAPTAERTSSPPTEFGGDALIWAAWMYYVDALTQNEVAQALGVSRASVANYLAEARRRGLVKIELAPQLLAAVSRSRELAQRFGLDGAFVAPDVDAPPAVEDEVALRRRLGAAAAQVLAPHMRPNRTIGMAWGRTMLELARATPERSLPGMQVVQVSGSSLGDADSSPEACTALIAGRLGARCRNLYAPAVVSRPDVRDALLAEPTLQRHFERLRACDLVVFGVGELTRDVTWSDAEMLPGSIVDAYMERGAVAILIARFLAADGREVEGPISERHIGMALDDLLSTPTRFCVAGGTAKFEAIRAALAGGYATHLVTDAATARRLLEETP